MNSKNELLIYVESKNDESVYHALGPDVAQLFDRKSGELIKVNSDIVKKNLDVVVTELFSALDAIEEANTSKYEINEMEIALGISASGEVSILSTLSGSADVSTNIKLVIKKKDIK